MTERARHTIIADKIRGFWKGAYENADLVEYYRGLIALRKRLPGLCDKSEQAVKRMLWQEKKKGFVSFRLDNRGEIAENFREILVAFFTNYC